jgi:hypothetical protein
MASATIRLSIDPTTGKRTITVAYASDADMLPHEHEDAHRDIVEKLIEGGIAKPGDDVVVEREGTGQAGDLPATAAETERGREKA